MYASIHAAHLEGSHQLESPQLSSASSPVENGSSSHGACDRLKASGKIPVRLSESRSSFQLAQAGRQSEVVLPEGGENRETGSVVPTRNGSLGGYKELRDQADGSQA